MKMTYQRELRLFLKFFLISLISFQPGLYILIIYFAVGTISLSDFVNIYTTAFTGILPFFTFLFVASLPYFLWKLGLGIRIFLQRQFRPLTQWKDIISSRLFLLLFIPVIGVHLYLVYPKGYLLWRILHSRDSAFTNGVSFFGVGFPIAIIIFFLSFVGIFLFVYWCTYLFRYRKHFIPVGIGLVVLILIWGFHFRNIYAAQAWFENTLTTEMENIWGPVPFYDSEPHRGNVTQWGSLKIDQMQTPVVQRLETVFEQVPRNDWIVTTVFIAPVSSHWESHPPFLYLDDRELHRLEQIDRDVLTRFFTFHIRNHQLSNLFAPVIDTSITFPAVYRDFWRYLEGNYSQTDSVFLREYHTTIDKYLERETR